MEPLDPDCKEALEKHCHEAGLIASDPELVELARVVCGAAGEQSLSSWLSSPDKRALLEALARRFGELDANQLALAEDLLNQGKSVEQIIEEIEAALQEEEARRRRESDGPSF